MIDAASYDGMVVDAHRVTLNSVNDLSELAELARTSRLRPDEVVAVTRKTAGWGDDYDLSHVDADHAVRRFLLEHGKRTPQHIERIPMAFSAGVGTILTPHLVVYTRAPGAATPDRIWMSAGAVQQGPAGGGTLAVVVDVE